MCYESKPDAISSGSCRLCNGATRLEFEKQILGKYQIAFHECEVCGSLQTDEPYWLEEAYADGIRILDVGAVVRAQNIQRIVYLLAKFHGLNSGAKILDWGAGDGLIVRMFRDVGLDAFHWDPYARNTYAAGFDRELDSVYQMITAFEVWEHLPNPAEELGKIFGQNPSVHVATTCLYRRQGENWPYLNLLTGRHVFFYSEKAVEWIAREFGYLSEIYGDLIIFHRDAKHSMLRSFLKGKLLENRNSRFFKALFELKKKHGRNNIDHALMYDRLSKALKKECD